MQQLLCSVNNVSVSLKPFKKRKFSVREKTISLKLRLEFRTPKPRFSLAVMQLNPLLVTTENKHELAIMKELSAQAFSNKTERQICGMAIELTAFRYPRKLLPAKLGTDTTSPLKNKFSFWMQRLR